MNPIFSKINNCFLEAEKVLLLTHQNPDGDGCGSLLATMIYLRSLGKNAEAYVSQNPPSYLDFLPFFEELKDNARILERDWDLIVVLDNSDWEHAGLDPKIFKSATIINIDHHLSNPNYGDINLIDSRASSTGELIHRFFIDQKVKIDKSMAICLLNGILSDTNGLVNAATTSASVRIAGELMKNGANIHKTAGKVLHHKSIDGLRLWGEILSRLKVNHELNLAYTYVTEDEIKKSKADEEEIDGLTNFLNVISDVEWSMFLRINADHTRVSLRTKSENLDLSKLAAFFGGGGHQKAAGFTVPWKVVEENGQLKVV
ncbi:MAG: bifunctional oligoribonuclease/PAP phosphatase NrnA [Patescibacteria group bacterium]